ncbi:MAG TPA: hypothetical protein VF808_05065 [Ktedonobacterales bacterium]
MILAHRTSRWMVLVACRHCHHRGIFIVTFPRDGQATAASDLSLDLRHSSSDTSESARRWENPIPSITSLPYSTAYDEPITVRDVNAMRRFLADFNGDFHALFGGEPG